MWCTWLCYHGSLVYQFMLGNFWLTNKWRKSPNKFTICDFNWCLLTCTQFLKRKHIFTIISVIFAHVLPSAWHSFTILITSTWSMPRSPSEQHGCPWPHETSVPGHRVWVRYPGSTHSVWLVLTRTLSSLHPLPDHLFVPLLLSVHSMSAS